MSFSVGCFASRASVLQERLIGYLNFIVLIVWDTNTSTQYQGKGASEVGLLGWYPEKWSFSALAYKDEAFFRMLTDWSEPYGAVCQSKFQWPYEDVVSSRS